MVQKLKRNIAIIASLLALCLPVLAPVSASALTPQQGVCAGASNLQIGTGTNFDTTQNTDCTASTNDATSKVNQIITDVINIFSVVVGIIAVIMIIVGGFRYITSGGDSGKVGSAKNTILYALIGLVIVALAQIIVKFVLNKATTS